jgi:hypothetical protein
VLEELDRLLATYAAQAGLSLEEAREHVSCALTGDFAPPPTEAQPPARWDSGCPWA